MRATGPVVEPEEITAGIETVFAQFEKQKKDTNYRLDNEPAHPTKTVRSALVARACFDTSVSAPQANDLVKVIGVARAVASEGSLPADALGDLTGSRETTEYKNVLRGAYYYGDAARSLGLLTKSTDTDGRTHYHVTAFGEAFFTADTEEQSAALTVLVDEAAAANMPLVAEDGEGLADSTYERREKCIDSWESARDSGFPGVFTSAPIPAEQIAAARAAGDARWAQHLKDNPPREHRPQERYGATCPTCFQVTPAATGICQSCAD